MKYPKYLAVGLTALFITTASAATHPPAKMGKTDMGEAWVDLKGMTLYTFAKDIDGKSNCNGKCAKVWPPLRVAKGSKAFGEWTIVKRDDGTKQWAYNGQPFYRWIKDKKPGQVTGDGVDEFHIAK